ncbi:hypothetical protein BDV96DRAFT_683622 [Lophiotrema nucula]|uniref:Uncharacterized protein n=1 Tax=Lophiotrema nucula TaxID=690887 RepID=A0A6A5ZLP7_9PLEO|nr:hypothetical protein BDV96DRAFT_683622 [Lophiotrema nucula]
MPRPRLIGRPDAEESQRPTYFEELRENLKWGWTPDANFQKVLAAEQQIECALKDLPGDDLIDAVLPLRNRLVRLSDLVPTDQRLEHQGILQAIFELSMVLVDGIVEVLEENVNKGWKSNVAWKKQMAGYLISLDKIVEPAARMGRICGLEWEYTPNELSDLCGWMETHAGLFATLGVCGIFDFMKGTRGQLEDWADEMQEVEHEFEGSEPGFD